MDDDIKGVKEMYFFQRKEEKLSNVQKEIEF